MTCIYVVVIHKIHRYVVKRCEEKVSASSHKQGGVEWKREYMENVIFLNKRLQFTNDTAEYDITIDIPCNLLIMRSYIELTVVRTHKYTRAYKK